METRTRAKMSQADEAIREALACLPAPLAQRLGPVRFAVRANGEDVASRWRWGEGRVEVEVNESETSPHDCALELLTCLGQALWHSESAGERRAWLELLREEIEAGVEGEIDERALGEKRAMLASRILAASPRRLERYAELSFAGTMAEYVHSLWHEVTVQTGPDYLPLPWLRRRFALFSRWFPGARSTKPGPQRHSCGGLPHSAR
jgi:hypothetical protein